MYIQLNSQVLYYEHHEGPGQALILLHGNGDDHTFYDGCIDKLSEYDVYVLDLRGHGLSATPKNYHYRDMADDLSSFVASLGIDKPIIFGYRTGGNVALLSAVLNSKIYGKLIVAGANLASSDFTFSGKLEIKKQIKEEKKNGFYERALMMLTEPEITDADLVKISAPVVVVAGDKDIVKSSVSKHMAQVIPNARLDMQKDALDGGKIWSILSSALI